MKKLCRGDLTEEEEVKEHTVRDKSESQAPPAGQTWALQKLDLREPLPCTEWALGSTPRRSCSLGRARAPENTEASFIREVSLAFVNCSKGIAVPPDFNNKVYCGEEGRKRKDKVLQ
ncbi:unnamed protein product [Pleuronectes platessa]|uniref:Uncharacterized protein n=1 Tax=Pleuronectes platessa TaxID=8262 RepID=A0A9N7UC13_PLEPL|nr:unnamed protein product [Pleuronectes platessa]